MAKLMDLIFLFLAPYALLNCHKENIWMEVAKFFSHGCLKWWDMYFCMIGSEKHNVFRRLKRRLQRLIYNDSAWKLSCLRDLQVPEPPHVAFSWIQLYTSAFDGSHSYLFRQRDKHIDWVRIGAFYISSPNVLLTKRLEVPINVPHGETIQQMLQTSGSCILSNIKTGIWIADLQLIKCPVCSDSSCEGTMLTLDARHFELFLTQGYRDGSWEYQSIGCHEIEMHSGLAAYGIFDLAHLKDPPATDLADFYSWPVTLVDWQPKARTALHAVAAYCNLEDPGGICVQYDAMRAGPDGEVVSIRISQYLL
ncbi:hypothetical protein ACHQM5_011502 [Ranunculus cassubicifolius]